MNDTIRQRMATWCQPISEETFCGEPSRYEEEFIQLQEELAKLKSIHDEVCDWDVVYTCADQLLRTKSKDMTALGALCVALLRREGMEGLTAGLGAYRWLFKTHGDELFPKPNRRRGRAGAFSWLAEHLTRELEQRQEEQQEPDADLETLKSCLKIFEETDTLLREQLQELHPRVGPIKAALAAMVEQAAAAAPPPPPVPDASTPGVPAPDASTPDASTPDASTPDASTPDASANEVSAPVGAVPDAAAPDASASATPQEAPQPQAPAPAPPPRAQAPSPPAAAPDAISSHAEADQALDAVVSTLRKCALYHLEADPEGPMGYHLAHLASFAGVVPGGTRMAAGPNTESFRSMQTAVEEARWDDVLERAREMLRRGPLDLNVESWLARALEAKGHKLALEALRGHVVSMRMRMGKRMRGTPDTEQWIDRMMGGLGGGPSAPSSPGPGGAGAGAGAPKEEVATKSPDRADLDAVIASASEVSATSGLGDGCEVLQDALSTTATRPDRFRLRLALARICVAGGASDLARPILQELLEELEQPVRTWDPKLLARVANALLACDRELAAKASKETRAALEEEANRMLTLLARIDPRTAILERKKR
jgi:predicted component of type VI protein secretion system